MEKTSNRSYVRNWIAFFVLGLINNLAYVVVNSAAQSLSKQFCKENLIGLVPWANVAFGFFARLVNTFLILSWPYGWRVSIMVFLMTVGLVGVAMSVYINFWFAICAIVIIGISSSFGESVILGFLKNFPSELVGAWSSGTGGAGVGGSGLYLGFQALKLTNLQSFILMIPTSFIYAAAYFFGVDHSGRIDTSHQHTTEANGHSIDKKTTIDSAILPSSPVTRPSGGAILPEHSAEREDRPLLLDPAPQPPSSVASSASGSSVNSAHYDSVPETPNRKRSRSRSRSSEDGNANAVHESTGQKYLRCFKLVGWRAFNLMMVYFFEYVASTGAADKANSNSTSKAWMIVHSYAILAFCYQFGVLISRSSLMVIKIRWVEALTILQGINFVLWLLEAHFHFMNIWVQMVAMVYVGLLGGASYVNIFYLILHDEETSDNDKELCVNICAFASTFGITFSSLFVLLMDATFLASPSSHTTNTTVICNVTRPHHPW